MTLISTVCSLIGTSVALGMALFVATKQAWAVDAGLSFYEGLFQK
jgi:hypothetical protein